MNKFYIDIQHGIDHHGNDIKFAFVSKRLAVELAKNQGNAMSYYKIHPFWTYDGKYLAVLISSEGVVIFCKYKDYN